MSRTWEEKRKGSTSGNRVSFLCSSHLAIGISVGFPVSSRLYQSMMDTGQSICHVQVQDGPSAISWHRCWLLFIASMCFYSLDMEMKETSFSSRIWSFPFFLVISFCYLGLKTRERKRASEKAKTTRTQRVTIEQSRMWVRLIIIITSAPTTTALRSAV